MSGAALFVLNVPEFQPVIEAAVKGGAEQESLGHYVKVGASGRLKIRREDTGLIEAIWFGALTGGISGQVKKFDSEELVIRES